MKSEERVIRECLRTLFAMSQQERDLMGLRLSEDRFAWPTIAKQMCDVYEWGLGMCGRASCVRMK